jgi:hypothetical protein
MSSLTSSSTPFGAFSMLLALAVTILGAFRQNMPATACTSTKPFYQMLVV